MTPSQAKRGVPAKTTAEEWLDGAFQQIVARGIKGLSVEGLAKSLGVSKGGFYWHFSNRDDILMAALQRWEHIVIDGFIEAMASRGIAPREALAKAMRFVIDHPESAPGGAIELSFYEWAREDERVFEVVQRVYRRRLEVCTQMYRQIGLEADDAAAHGTGFIAYMTGMAVHQFLLDEQEIEEQFRQGVKLWIEDISA